MINVNFLSTYSVQSLGEEEESEEDGPLEDHEMELISEEFSSAPDSLLENANLVAGTKLEGEERKRRNKPHLEEPEIKRFRAL